MGLTRRCACLAARFTRRVELIAAPITTFEAASRRQALSTAWVGLGLRRHYRSTVGADSSATKKNNPDRSRYVDARSGTVEINSAVATSWATFTAAFTPRRHVINTNSIPFVDNKLPFSLLPITAGTSQLGVYLIIRGDGNTRYSPASGAHKVLITI